MSKQLYIKPCHENWEQMTPDERGRFCAVCHKSVINLEQASVQEISRIAEAHSYNLCVRIPESLVVPVPRFTFRQFALSTLAALAMLFFGNKATAQTTKPKTAPPSKPKPHALPAKNNKKTKQAVVTRKPVIASVRGRISEQYDGRLIPLPQVVVNVTIDSVVHTAQTNDSGYYCIEFPVRFITDTIRAVVSTVKSEYEHSSAEILLQRKQPHTTLSMVKVRNAVRIVHLVGAMVDGPRFYSLIPLKKQRLLIREPGKTTITSEGVKVYRYDDINTLIDRTVVK